MFSIRDADPQRDAAACAEIYAPHVEGSAVSFEERAPGAGEMAARIGRYGASHAWLVAERDGKVAGYAYATAFNERPAYRWSTSVSVYVAEEARGQGVGRALYEALFDRLRERGFRMACAGITLPNEASAGLHEHLGFELVGVNREIGWKHGAWRDVGWYQLELAPTPNGSPPSRADRPATMGPCLTTRSPRPISNPPPPRPTTTKPSPRRTSTRCSRR